MKEEEGRETELAIFFFPLVVGAFSGHRPTHNCGSPDQHIFDQLILCVHASQAPFLSKLIRDYAATLAAHLKNDFQNSSRSYPLKRASSSGATFYSGRLITFE